MAAIVSLFFVFPAFAQSRWSPGELSNAFDGKKVQPTLMLLNEKGITPYDYGFQLYQHGHSHKSLLWFRAMALEISKTDEKASLKYTYGYAFVSWATGDKDGAVTDLNFILRKKPDDLVLARSYLLLGTIERSKLNLERANEMLHKSIALYTALDLPGGLSRCYRILATCATQVGKFEEAEAYLAKSEEFNNQAVAKGFRSLKPGKTLEIKAHIKMARGDYSAALDLFKQCLEEYKVSPSGADVGVIEAQIALLTLQAGNPSKAAQLCRDISKRYTLTNNTRVLAYNAITAMKMSMCAQQFEEAAKHEADIRRWAEGEGAPAKQVLDFMELVKSDEGRFPCPKWR